VSYPSGDRWIVRPDNDDNSPAALFRSFATEAEAEAYELALEDLADELAAKLEGVRDELEEVREALADADTELAEARAAGWVLP
jgi:uncharacterized membrane protein